MAKATKQQITTYTITLEMTQDEAETLKGVTEFIGGPENGKRGHMSKIGHALYDAGIRSGFTGSDIDPANRAIYFLKKG